MKQSDVDDLIEVGFLPARVIIVAVNTLLCASGCAVGMVGMALSGALLAVVIGVVVLLGMAIF